MKKKTGQSGSVHAVIIAVLLVALMAALGVVFYQNFIAKKQSNTTQKQPAATQPSDTLKTARVAFNSTIYDLDYPTGWTAETTKTGSGSTTAITSASKAVQVTFAVSNKAASAPCDSSDGLKITSYHVAATTANKLVGVPLYLVETMSDSAGGGYQYAIGLVPDSGDTHANVGDTHCNIAHVGIASSAVYSGKTLASPTVLANINFPKLPKAPKAAAKDMQTIKDLMNTDDYKAAVKILESARKE